MRDVETRVQRNVLGDNRTLERRGIVVDHVAIRRQDRPAEPIDPVLPGPIEQLVGAARPGRPRFDRPREGTARELEYPVAQRDADAFEAVANIDDQHAQDDRPQSLAEGAESPTEKSRPFPSVQLEDGP